MDYEKLGLFYLGRPYDPTRPDGEKLRPEPFLYDSRHLLTHAVILGMTGSGKTGLAMALLEEAAIDNIPALIIDPKGDLSNLLLTFPALAAGDFAPYVDTDEANRRGITVDALAAETATRWQTGLADWAQTGARIQKLRDAATVTVYTPGSTAGEKLAVLRPLTAPPEAVRNDPELVRERIGGAVASLLGLLGVDADPMRSREHILLSAIVEAVWQQGKDLDLPQLIPLVQRPPIDRVGVLDLESFFPSKDRGALAMQLNALYASPLYKTWAEGEPLDIARLLATPEGKPRLSVLSIAHLSDEQRQFFVAVFLHEVIAWMRQQSGTTSLRALLYMDEIFGYFPPTANPPTKPPMLTLLKQARAFGLGVVLATQNPVDLDYKALGNAGTWMVGRLQQERDRLRLLDGLEGAAAASGRSFDRAQQERLLSSLDKRVFLVNDVHADGPTLVHSRWTLSYLRGPLTRDLLQRAQPKKTAATSTGVSPSGSPHVNVNVNVNVNAPSPLPLRPSVPPAIHEVFLPTRLTTPNGPLHPFVLAKLRLHYADRKLGLDTWQKLTLLAPIGKAVLDCNWDDAAVLPASETPLDRAPDGAQFAEIAPAALRATSYTKWERAAKTHAYAHRPLTLRRAAALELVALPDESPEAFAGRVQLAAREQRDAAIAALQNKYAPKLTALDDKIREAEAKLLREKSEVRTEAVDTALSVGAGILGALLGRKVASASNVGRVRAAAKGANRTMKQNSDVAAVEQKLATLRTQRAALAADVEAALQALEAQHAPQSLAIDTVEVAAKKADISVEGIYLAWG